MKAKHGVVAMSKSTGGTYVAFVAYAVLFGKVFLANGLEQGIWIDGDGLRRLAEISEMSVYGITAPDLGTATAGYATIVHIVGVLLGTTTLWPIAMLQSALFSFAVWYLAVGLRRTRIAWAMVPFAYLALLNPPLSLSSLALSSDSVTASLLMIAIGQLLRDMATPRDARTPRRILLSAGLLSLAALMAPMLALGGIVFLLSWAAARGNREQAIWISSGALALLLALPLMLLVRNQMANNSAMLPSSSAQMAPVTSGFKDFDGSRCGIGSIDVVSLNVPKFRCLMSWYQEASANTSEAAVPNAAAFWSPWVGPLAGAQLSDNPWPALHPAIMLSDASNPRSLWRSPAATVLSWLWLFAACAALLMGLVALRGMGVLESELSAGAGWLVGGTWLAAILTSADPSSRLPVMGPVLLLQLLGWRYMITRGRASSRDPFAPR